MEDAPNIPCMSPAQPRRAKTRRSGGNAIAGEKSRRTFRYDEVRTTRARGTGEGASPTKEIVFADSGLADEVAVWVERVSRASFSVSC